MKKVLLNLIFLLAGIGLAGCSSWQSGQPTGYSQGYGYSSNETQGGVPKPPETLVTNSSPTGERGVGGSLANSMDVNDRSKLSHALDKAPGNATRWVNAVTGISYTVVPTKKLTINDNPYCRAYNVTANREGRTQELNGTACVGSDGSWQAIKGG